MGPCFFFGGGGTPKGNKEPMLGFLFLFKATKTGVASTKRQPLRGWFSHRVIQPMGVLKDQGVYAHFCDTRESPPFYGKLVFAKPPFCCITEVDSISHSPVKDRFPTLPPLGFIDALQLGFGYRSRGLILLTKAKFL